MKKFKRILRILILLITVVVAFSAYKIAPVAVSGYKMYKEALHENSVEDVISNIKAKKTYITIDEIPTEYKEEVVHSEDKRFYSHSGIDFIAISRAMYNNLKAGSFIQGGSTITQQLAKNMYFSFDKKLERKIAEMFMAFKLESMLTKNEILELYCNITYLGEGCYGIKEAAQYYYSSSPNELTTSQISTLVFSFRNPEKYNPKALTKILI